MGYVACHNTKCVRVSFVFPKWSTHAPKSRNIFILACALVVGDGKVSSERGGVGREKVELEVVARVRLERLEIGAGMYLRLFCVGGARCNY